MVELLTKLCLFNPLAMSAHLCPVILILFLVVVVKGSFKIQPLKVSQNTQLNQALVIEIPNSFSPTYNTSKQLSRLNSPKSCQQLCRYTCTLLNIGMYQELVLSFLRGSYGRLQGTCWLQELYPWGQLLLLAKLSGQRRSST